MYGNQGSILTDRFFGAKAKCPVCGNRLTYRAGAELAREKGIYDDVLVCGGCMHVYTCVLIPGRLELQDDVTARYPGAGVPSRREEAEKPGGRKGLFSKRIRK